MLRVEGLVAGYGRLAILKVISLEVQPGEIVSVIGPNGAGKTTLLRCLTGLIVPRAGRIAWEGQDLAGMPPHRVVAAGISMVPEGRRVFGPLSVQDNLLLGAYHRVHRGDRWAEIERDREQVLSLFPILRARARQPAGTLSGGEQQMLAIGRTLMARPKFLLLDEPSLGLAPLVVAEIFAVITRLHQEGMTILLVEQNARMALQCARRGYVLESGAIVLSGKTSELLTVDRVKRAYLGEP